MQTLGAYAKDPKKKYIRAVTAGPPKMGKTTGLVSHVLGAFPGQVGSLVTSPKHLHVIGFDEAFAEGLAEFLTDNLKQAPGVLDICLYDLSNAREKAGLGAEWNYDFFNKVLATIKEIRDAIAKLPGTHAVIASSVTGMVEGLKAGIAGRVGEGAKGTGMSIPKWGELDRCVAEIRNTMSALDAHVLWEAHVIPGNGENPKDTIGLLGKAAHTFTANVGHTWKLMREPSKYPGFNAERVSFGTKPDFFGSGGRKAAILADKETDLTVIAQKLGVECATAKSPTPQTA